MNSKIKKKIIKQVPSHPRERFKCAVATLNDELQFIKQVPAHPQDRLRRRQNLNDVQFIKQQPVHPRGRLLKKAKGRKVKVPKKMAQNKYVDDL